MEGWNEITRITALNPKLTKKSKADVIPGASISSLQFDSHHDLLWCGDSNGYVQSFANVNLSKYTSFRTSKSPILQNLNYSDKGILSLSKGSINLNNTRGVCNLLVSSSTLKNDNFHNLSCMNFNCNSSNDLLVSSSNSLFKLDLLKPTVVTELDYSDRLSFIKQSNRMLALGKTNGTIDILEPQTNKRLKSFFGHNGLLSDMDSLGNYVATCGYSVRPNNHASSGSDYVIDPLVNIYDLRMLKPLTPIAFPSGASFVRFHPKLPNILIVASTTGQIHFINIYDQSNLYLYQTDIGGSYISNLEVSSNGEFLSFNDGFNNVHLWSYQAFSLNESNKSFNNFSHSLKIPDIPSGNIPFIQVDEEAPLSSIGLPYYKDLLLSNYANNLKFIKSSAKLPPKVDIDLITTSKNVDGILFNHYDRAKYGGRNLAISYYLLNQKKNGRAAIPKFISERTNSSSNLNNISGSSSSTTSSNPLVDKNNDDIFQFKNSDDSLTDPPNCYQKLEILYSKFGVEDFDFSYYNKTRYSGLENHISNSYINSILQLYRFVPEIFNFVVSNLAREWLPTLNESPIGSSIFIELGYLYDMLAKAKGKNCCSSNFQTVFNNLPEAKQLGLLSNSTENPLTASNLQHFIIGFNRFLLNRLNHDSLQQLHESNQLINDFGFEIDTEIESSGCNIHDCKRNISFTLNLISPPTIPSHNKFMTNVVNNVSLKKSNNNLLNYLDYSMNQYQTIRCNCNTTNKYHIIEISESVRRLPNIISINLDMNSQELNNIKNSKRWLLPEFYSHQTPKGKISFKSVTTQFSPNVNKYELVGYVAKISSNDDSHHLVSFVRIKEDGINKWYLFNDFLVMQLPEEEIFNLSYSWKTPLILLYKNSDLKTEFDYKSYMANLNDSILYRDHFAAGTREGKRIEYKLLTKEDPPTAGALVAIDAEFVTLQSDEVEIRSDGTKSLIKPRTLSLARVSALKDTDDTPFIDDYIVTTEHIDDYLTSYSGIEPGDLDPNVSSRSLVTLQTAYRKLWLLLNLGVVFVGHGLQNDFRTINLQVPREQIRDTADLFYLPEYKRKLSLKFLAYVLLQENVQIGNHDSIEDARTALHLYLKYQELIENPADFENVLVSIYQKGQRLRFKVPV